MQRVSPILYLIIITYLILGYLYATLTPPWQTPDEPAHYNFVRYVSEVGQLPELTMGCYDAAYLGQLTSEKFPPHLSIDTVCYEHYQPPLYYILASPIFTLSGGNLIAVRLFSVVLGGISLFFVYQTICLFSQSTTIPLTTTAVVAFVPMHLTMLSAVNNDSLAELLLVLLVYLTLRWHLQKRVQGQPVPYWIGIILGLILLTKVTIYISIPIVALVLLLGDRHPANLIKQGVRVYLPAFVIALPWYIRNSLVYGGVDILGLRRHDAVVVGQLRTADYVADVGLSHYFSTLTTTVFHSFWGQFGWMAVPMDNRVYQALMVLQVLGLCGIILWLWKKPPTTKQAKHGLWVMISIIILALGIFVGLNRSFVQFQGRYFFTALMPLALFFSLGLSAALKREAAVYVAAGLFVLTCWVGLQSLLTTGLDKWGVLITGGAFIAILARRWIPLEQPRWFLAFVCSGLAGLSALSIWWFIIPNLS
ncbi:MAG: DUF2142 domain-containing protein [Chloroflexota bacterium]